VGPGGVRRARGGSGGRRGRPRRTRPDYFVLLQVEGDRVTAIRDYRYVTYLAAEADFDLTPP